MNIVWDFHDTLVDTSKIRHLLEGPSKDFDAFYLGSTGCPAIEAAVKLYRRLQVSPGTVMQVWTGCSDKYRDQVVNWLRGHDIHFQYLFMRPEGDHSPDHELKVKWMRENPAGMPVVMFDDRARAIDVYRQLGVFVCDVAGNAW